MFKSSISLIITLLAALLALVGTKIGTAKFIENLMYFVGPIATFAVLTAGLFIFFGFFSARFFRWYHRDPQRRRSGKSSWTLSPLQSLNIILGTAAVVVIYDSTETILFLAARIHDILLWLIFALFMILLLFSAVQQDRLEKRFDRNPANWWRG